MPGGRYPWAVRAGGPLLGSGTLISTSFQDTGSVPNTWTMSGEAKNVKTTTDGVIDWYQEIDSNEVPFWGLRRTKNILPTGDLAGWLAQNGAVKDSNSQVTFPGLGPTERLLEATVNNPIGQANCLCMTISTVSGSATISLRASGAGSDNTNVNIDVDETPKPYTLRDPGNGGVGTINWLIENDAAGGPFAVTLNITEISVSQMRSVDDAPPDYVDPEQEHGALVNGVKYFNTANGAVVDPITNEVTPGTGPSLISIRPNPGVYNNSVPGDLVLINGVPNTSFDSTVSTPTTIFVRVAGDDGNDGLSEGQAVRTVDKALEIAATSGSSGDGYRIDIGAGRYYQSDVYPTAPVAARIADFRDIELIGSGVRPYLMNAVDPIGVSWVDNADGTYTATVTDVNHPADLASLDSDGMPIKLQSVADLPELLAAPQGYFVVGNDIRIKPIRSGVPDNDLILFLSTLSTINSFRNFNFYLNNIAWFGFKLECNPTGAGDYTVVCDDCLFGYIPSTAGDCVSMVQGTVGIGEPKRILFRDCKCAYAENDGFNYASLCFGLEYRCTVYETEGQTSTGHTGSAQVRVGGTYRDAIGAAVVADVDPSTRTWMYNCSVRNSPVADIQHGGKCFLEQINFTGTTSPDSLVDVGSAEFFHDDLTGVVGTLPSSYTEFEGIRQSGVKIETRKTNLVDVADRRDLTTASWVKTGCTALLDAKGIDGRDNSASTLTATGAAATALLTLTSASAAHVPQFFVRRKTGTGTIEITLDNGATWTDITFDLSQDLFVPFQTTPQTLANPVIGFRIGTSGDEIKIDAVQCEVGSNPSSSMLAQIGQRAEDELSTDVAAPDTGYTAYCEATSVAVPGDGLAVIGNGGSFYSVGIKTDGDYGVVVSGVNTRIDANDWLGTRRKVSLSNPNDGSGDAILSATGQSSVTATTTLANTSTFNIGRRGTALRQWDGLIHDVTVFVGAFNQSQNENLVK